MSKHVDEDLKELYEASSLSYCLSFEEFVDFMEGESCQKIRKPVTKSRKEKENE